MTMIKMTKEHLYRHFVENIEQQIEFNELASFHIDKLTSELYVSLFKDVMEDYLSSIDPDDPFSKTIRWAQIYDKAYFLGHEHVKNYEWTLPSKLRTGIVANTAFEVTTNVLAEISCHTIFSQFSPYYVGEDEEAERGIDLFWKNKLQNKN